MVRPVGSGRGVADIFDEISEDLRAERAKALLKRYGGLLVLLAVLVIVGVAGWQFWRSRAETRTATVAQAFIAAGRDAGGAPTGSSDAAKIGAAAAFASVAADAPEGYRTLARLREAGLRATAGDLPGALGLWNQVSADTAADPLLRGLADLQWVQHQVDAGEPAAVEGRLAPLLAPGNPWRPLALESEAWLALRTGQDARARDILKGLRADGLAPGGVRNRANGLLTRLGEPSDPSAAATDEAAGG